MIWVMGMKKDWIFEIGERDWSDLVCGCILGFWSGEK